MTFTLAMALLAACASAPEQAPAHALPSWDWRSAFDQMHELPAEVAEVQSRDLIQKVVEDNLFTIDRGLKDYQDYFGPTFVRDLKGLGKKGHWIDGGAGNAYAQKDFLGSRDGHRILPRKPWMTAITLKYPGDQPRALDHGRFRVLADRFFEDIPLDEIRKADLITDVVGILNYTSQLDTVLERYLDLLNPGGKIYVFIPNTITFIQRGHSRLSLTDWLSSIPGLSIGAVESKASPYSPKYSFTIEKTACGIRIPRLKLSAAAHQRALVREFTEQDSSSSWVGD